MKLILAVLITCTIVYAKEYYSKVEPYEIRTIMSNVTGIVLLTENDMIGKQLSKSIFIKIDSELDEDELEAVKKKLLFVKNTLSLNEKVLKNIKSTLDRKRVNYEKIKNLKIKSRIEKDKEFYDMLNAENSYLSTKKEMNTLRTNIADLELRKAQLIKTLHDKNIAAEGFVLYDILVKVGQAVNTTTPLAKIADVSKGLLTLYLDEDDLRNLENKAIFINGKKTKYKISRVSYIADETNISKYKAQIVVDAPKVFSNVVKIELKDR